MRSKFLALLIVLVVAAGGVTFWLHRDDNAGSAAADSMVASHEDFTGGVVAPEGQYPDAPAGWTQPEIDGIAAQLQRFMTAAAMDYRTDGDVDTASGATVAALPSAVQDIPESDWARDVDPADHRLFLSTVFADGTEVSGEPVVLHRSWQSEVTPPEGEFWEYVSLTLTEVVGYEITAPVRSYVIVRRSATMSANHADSPAIYYPAFNVYSRISLNIEEQNACEWVLDATIRPIAAESTEDEFKEFIDGWNRIIADPNAEDPNADDYDGDQVSVKQAAQNCTDGKQPFDTGR